MLGQLTGVRTVHQSGGKVWQFQWLITSIGVTVNAISTMDGRFSSIAPIDYLGKIVSLLQESKTSTRPETINDAVEQYQDFALKTTPIIPVRLIGDFSIGADYVDGLILPTGEFQVSPLDWKYLNKKIFIVSRYGTSASKVHPVPDEVSAAESEIRFDVEEEQDNPGSVSKSLNNTPATAQVETNIDTSSKLQAIFVATIAVNIDDAIRQRLELQRLRNHLNQLIEHTTSSKAKNLYQRDISIINQLLKLLSGIIYSSRPQPIIMYLDDTSEDKRNDK